MRMWDMSGLGLLAPDIFYKIGNPIRGAAAAGGYDAEDYYHDQLTRWVMSKDGGRKTVQVQLVCGDNFPDKPDYRIHIHAEAFDEETRGWKPSSYNHTIPIPMRSFILLGEIGADMINEVGESLKAAIKSLDEE